MEQSLLLLESNVNEVKPDPSPTLFLQKSRARSRRRDLQPLIGGAAADQIESVETERCQLMSIRSQTSREIRGRHKKPVQRLSSIG